MTIIKRRATTVFDRYNYTILDVIELDENWETTNYGSEDFLALFDSVFHFDPTQPDWSTSVQFSFVNTLAAYLTNRIQKQEVSGADEGLSSLRALFAVPILEFNNVVFGGPYSDDLGSSISLAKISYRVTPTGS